MNPFGNAEPRDTLTKEWSMADVPATPDGRRGFTRSYWTRRGRAGGFTVVRHLEMIVEDEQGARLRSVAAVVMHADASA